MRRIASHPILMDVVLVAGLALLLAGCPKKVGPSAEPTLSTSMYGLVKGGKGSGVVGGPIEGVEVTARYGSKTIGPVTTDASGSFTLESSPLFPAGTNLTLEQLESVEPIVVDLKFVKPGYKTQIETITFPISKYEEFTCYMSGESE